MNDDTAAAVEYVRANVRHDVGLAYTIAAHTVDGRCDLSVRQLAAAAGINPATVARAVDRLTAAGVLVVERTTRGNVYRFPVAQPCASDARSRAPRVQLAAVADAAQPCASDARSRAPRARSSASDARPAPGGGGTSTRRADRTATTTAPELLPHAQAALDELAGYIAAAADAPGIVNRLAYRAATRRRVVDELAGLQAAVVDVDELVRAIAGDPTPDPVAAVEARLAAAWAMPPRPELVELPGPAAEYEPDHERARAAFQAGIEQARAERGRSVGSEP